MKKELGLWLHSNWVALKFYLFGHLAGFLFHRKKNGRPNPPTDYGHDGNGD